MAEEITVCVKCGQPMEAEDVEWVCSSCGSRTPRLPYHMRLERDVG